MGLEENLRMATQVACVVRQQVPKSSNTDWTSSPIKFTSGNQIKIINRVPNWKLDEEVRQHLDTDLPTTPQGWLKSFSEIDKLCQKKGMGNCGELAAMACLRLRNLRAFPVELVEIWDGITNNPALPHVICVIGRTQIDGPHIWPSDGSSIGLPNSWHTDAVICDPWDRVAYPANDYEPFWSNLIKLAKGSLSCILMHQL